MDPDVVPHPAALLDEHADLLPLDLRDPEDEAPVVEQDVIAQAHIAGEPLVVDRDDPLVSRVIRDCDAQLQRVDPRQHDAAVAVTSHLPQILSTALAAYIGERRAAGGGRELLDFAGSGLETFLRLAGSDASVWRPLIESNRANIQSHIDGVLRVVRDILDGDSKAFARAQQLLRDLTNR